MKIQSASYINGVSLQETPRENLEQLSFSNSAFLWGDSAFSTGLIENGEITLWEGHKDRLISSCDWLYGDNKFYQEIEDTLFNLIKKNHSNYTGKFRITFFYEGASKKPCWTLNLSPLVSAKELKFVTKESPFTLNQRKKDVKVGSYADVYQMKRKFKLDEDICLINKDNEIIEGMHSALLFWHKEKQEWILPLTSEYKLKSIGLHYGLKDLKYKEEKINISELSDYSAAFSINAVYKAVPITQINDIKFTKSVEMKDSLIELWSKE